MCRFLAYHGEPILLETLITAPCHSLIHQSLHATEGKTETNGDGFGVGWYGERETPGLYREVRPAWSDENLRSIAAQVRSRSFFAHVRAATGTPTSRANCHPFAHGRYLFMHNGQIGGWSKIRRTVEAMIPDNLYAHRTGTTDSEAIFLAALGQGLESDPIQALQATLARIKSAMHQAAIKEPLRFTATLTDGETIWAFRWSNDARPPSLYFKQDEAGMRLVSEPIDGNRQGWNEIPIGATLTAHAGQIVELAQAA